MRVVKGNRPHRGIIILFEISKANIKYQILNIIILNNRYWILVFATSEQGLSRQDNMGVVKGDCRNRQAKLNLRSFNVYKFPSWIAPFWGKLSSSSSSDFHIEGVYHHYNHNHNFLLVIFLIMIIMIIITIIILIIIAVIIIIIVIIIRFSYWGWRECLRWKTSPVFLLHQICATCSRRLPCLRKYTI